MQRTKNSFGWGLGLSCLATLGGVIASANVTPGKSMVLPKMEDMVARYPTFMKFIREATFTPAPISDPGLAKVMSAKKAYRPTAEQWDQFLKASVADGLTNFRAFALMGLEAKARGVTLWGPGRDYEQAVERNQIDLGLSLPATHVIVGMWEPENRPNEPDFLLHIKLIYDQPYIHEFPDEVMPANLKVGTGDAIHFTFEGKDRTGYAMEADLFYGNGKLGFRNVKGVGGQKRGFLGVVQKIMFFVPDAIHSMVIDDSNGSMLTEAIINTTVEDFEKKPIYKIHYSKR